MRSFLLAGVGVLAAMTMATAQEKPVPKDSSRIFVPGCSKGRAFVVGARREDQPGRTDVAPGTRMRLNGPKGILDEIKKHEGSQIEVTGLVRKSDLEPQGVAIGGSVRVAPAMPPTSGGAGRSVSMNQIVIDVEGVRPLVGSCPQD